MEAGTHLLTLGHGAEGLGLVVHVAAVPGAAAAHGQATAQAVHTHHLRMVLRALLLLHQLAVPHHIPLGGVHQVVLGLGPRGRVVFVPAALAVEHLALGAHHRGLGRLRALAFVALGLELLAVVVLVHDGLQGAVARQGQGSAVLQEDEALAHHASYGPRAGLQGLDEDVGHARRSDVGRGSAVADHAAVRLADDAQLVDVREVQEGDLVAGQGRPVLQGGLGQVVGRWLLQGQSAGHAQGVRAREQNRLGVHATTYWTLQFFIHDCKKLCCAARKR